MPSALAPIPAGVAIVDRDFAITEFMRLRWQQLIDAFQVSPTRYNQQIAVGKTAALATTLLYTTVTSGMYRVVVYTEKTVAAGVTSSLTVTSGWTRGASPLVNTGAALATDAIGANASYVHEFQADAASPINVSIAYASNPATTMVYSAWATVEQLA